MGYAVMMGNCFACGKLFQFHPHKVPSLLVEGIRQAICRSCAERWNELNPDKARPILAGAYDHFDENEL